MSQVKRSEGPLPPRERALATRRRICAAAAELFIATGYAATTMEQIAASAGVAVQTVYFVFHTKAEVLRTVFDAAVVGDVSAPPPEQQSWFSQALDEPDPRRALELFVNGNATILGRVGPLVPVLVGSGVPGIRELFTSREELRWAAFRRFIGSLERRKALSVAPKTATDILFTLASPQAHALLNGRGWSERRWKTWTTHVLCTQILTAPSDD